MFIKKFEAQSLEQALSMVKSELGPNALILSTENKKGKWFNKPLVEVTAAYDQAGDKVDTSNTFTEESLLEVFPHRKRSRVEEEPAPAPSVRKNRVARYADYPPTAAKTQSSNERNFEASFLRAGLSPEGASDLSKQLVFDYPKKDLEIPAFLDKAMTRSILPSLGTLSPTVFEQRSRWTAVGISGSGKTSSLVKLALFLKGAGRQVTLSSIDRQKLLGRRELSSYAKLIQVPYGEHGAPGKANGIELCDSPAYPLQDPASSVIADIERSCMERSVVLVLDASMRLREALRVVEIVSSRLHLTAVSFTRLDSVSQHGIIHDVLKRTKLPLLGASVSPSFKVGFKFFEAPELASYILRTKN